MAFATPVDEPRDDPRPQLYIMALIFLSVSLVVLLFFTALPLFTGSTKPRKIARTTPKTSARTPSLPTTHQNSVSPSAIDEERNRLATKLHDGLGQTMTVLLFRSEAVTRKLRFNQVPTVAESDQLLELAEKASDELRTVMQSLRSM